MAIDLSNFIPALMGTGFYSMFMPFFLIFTCMFIALKTIKLFTKLQRVAVASIFAFIAIIMHSLEMYPTCFDVIDIINASLPQIGIAAGLIILIITAFSLMDIDEVVSASFYPWLYFAVFLYVIITIFSFNEGVCNPIFPVDPRYRFIVPAVFLVFGIIKMIISRNNSSGATP